MLSEAGSLQENYHVCLHCLGKVIGIKVLKVPATTVDYFCCSLLDLLFFELLLVIRRVC